MVHFRRFIGVAAVLSALNLAGALPQPGDLSQQSGYGSGSQGNNNNYGSNSGYDSSNMGSNSSGYGSSKGSNNSGYDSSKGSNNSGYGSSKGSDNSNNYGNNDKTTSSSMMRETTTSTSSSMMETSTSTTMLESTSTMMAESSSSTSTSVMYGSGSMNSGSNSYNDCVAQCIASFSPTSTASSVNSGSSGSVGTGATKTVIVAPTKGVFRYVPFAVNASVGDTIKFVWKAGPHTVTKGSALQPCNATSDAAFTSMQQDVGFEFTQEVTSTDPTFFFCNVPTHCQKGMFGVINPPSNLNAPTSASGMMQSLKANNSDLKAYAAITDAATSGKPAALWGGSIELSSMPDWAQPLAAENILYTRNVLASNPELLQEDGTVDMSNVDSTPMMVPKDVSDALKDAATSTPSTSTSSSGSTPPANAAGAATTTSASSGPAPTSGATLTTPRAVLALFAVAATVLIL